MSAETRSRQRGALALRIVSRLPWPLIVPPFGTPAGAARAFASRPLLLAALRLLVVPGVAIPQPPAAAALLPARRPWLPQPRPAWPRATPGSQRAWPQHIRR